MRHAQPAVIAALAAIAVSASPALSFAHPAGLESAPVVTRVADLQRPSARKPHARPADSYWQWRYRATYTRWLHSEYVRAGYPVRQVRGRTYVRVDHGCCCARHRTW